MSLFKKIFFTITIVLLIFFALFVNHIIEKEKEKSLNTLLLKIKNSKQFYAPILSQLLFTFDKSALKIHLSSIYLDEEVSKIDFVDFSSKIDLKYTSKKITDKDLIKSNIPLNIDNDKLGMLTIFYTQTKIKDNIQTYKTNIIEISILFLILIFGIIFYFIKNFTKSIDTLAMATTQIAAGNLEVSINIKSNDEIGLLAEKFESMKNALINRINLIDQQKNEIQVSNEKLQKSNAFLLQSQTIADIGSWEINIKNNQLICSNQIARIFEVDTKELDTNYNDFIKFIHPQDRKRVQTTHKQSMENKQAYTLEYRIISDKNIIKTVEENCMHVFDKENNFIKTIGTIQNISEMKKKDNLLFQQSRMAAMGEMLENIAHQWRQPLSVISAAATGVKFRSNFDMLKQEDIDNSMDHINGSVQHLSQTIEDFRDFFKSDKKENQFILKDVFAKTLKLITSQFKTAEISIIENIEEISLFGLENELIQVLINILNNARDELIKKENQDKLILIDVTLKNNYVQILVKDNAGGIPSDILNDVFKSHFTTKQESSGTGVGLYMSKTIIEEHMKGNISVRNVSFLYEDKPYSGAEFKILLPVVTIEEA